ncbi:NAD(P)/FAD-dependent oxidoreductase [Luteimonas panaciterrae]|uniref:NAD(P)/FAD-dependent oxidoreductase n=1 Tax=Luteimonas panaciterrae TaxID=363885 RepID=UPI001CFA3EB4|nr:FAD-dependent oxidoreductase [Luteimonas panaciterrae]
MDLKSGYPWWAVRNGLLHEFPRLQHDVSCDVAVLGGGITGALVANELADHGHDVVVIEQNEIGWGSTAASTALLQYEIDTHMTELAKRYGEDVACLAYGACAEVIPWLAEIADRVGDVGFAYNHSLYWASKRRDRGKLEAEFKMRAQAGFDIEWLSADELRQRYGLEASGAILSRLGARVDPYRFAWRLLMRMEQQGTNVFDGSHIDRIETHARGVALHSAEGISVRARYVVLATGYIAQQWLKQKVARNRSSYAFITDRMDVNEIARMRGMLFWESARPYLYMRGTDDGRLLVGGADDAVDIPVRRDALVKRKSHQLAADVAARFPGLQPLRPAFSWGGTFAETEDGLPFFGPHPQHGTRVLFAMAYGGNGITYAGIGAQLLRSYVERQREQPLRKLFSFSRLSFRPL